MPTAYEQRKALSEPVRNDGYTICTNPESPAHNIVPACRNADFFYVGGGYYPNSERGHKWVIEWDNLHPDNPWIRRPECSCKRDADGYILDADRCPVHSRGFDITDDKPDAEQSDVDPAVEHTALIEPAVERAALIDAIRDAEQRYVDANIARSNAWDALREHDAVAKREAQRERIDQAFRDAIAAEQDVDALQASYQHARRG